MRFITLLLTLILPSLALAQPVQVQTQSVVLEATPAIETSAYATGDVISLEIELSGAGRPSALSGVIDSVIITDLDKETVDIDVVFFDSDPGAFGSVNAAFDPADADLVNIVCVVSLTTHQDYNDNGVSIARGVNCPFKLTGSTSLFAALVSRAAVTYTGTSDLTLRVGILQD